VNALYRRDDHTFGYGAIRSQAKDQMLKAVARPVLPARDNRAIHFSLHQAR
jgi:hypothetical protein